MDIFNLLTPAIALTVLAFLAKFFGKIISDQKPFADERDWDIELNGFNFILGFISYGVVGIALALAWQWTSTNWLAHAIVLFFVVFIGGVLLFADVKILSEKYNLKHPNSEQKEKDYLNKHPKLKNINSDMKMGNAALAWIGSRTPVWILWFFIPYFVTQEYLKQNIFWFIVILSHAFLSLILLAIRYSLQKTKPQKANIYFTDKQLPLTDVILLKVNTDNIRVRIEDKILILNKSKVDKIEMDIYQK